MAESRLSVSDKLLLAAYRCEQSGKQPFTAEDLVVSAWQCFPDTFGLKGYADARGKLLYPDSNRVFAEIMGSKPIRKRGLLVKTGRKLYELTGSGRSLASRLGVANASEDRVEVGGKVGLDRRLEAELRRLLSSRAAQKVDNEQVDTLTFHNACVFWRITPQSSAIELRGRHSDLEDVLRRLREGIRAGGRLEHGGPVVSPSSVDLLEKTHLVLTERFSDEVRTILGRTDQRRR